MLPLITRNQRALLLLFSLLINLPCYTLSDCAPSQPTLQEQFSISPLVVRVKFDESTTSNLPCGMEVYQDERGYVIQNSSFPSYTVMEIFKQDWSGAAAVVDREDDTDILKPGDTVPIILNTDTGFYRALPARLTEDPQGFLAFLLPYRYCLGVDEENELEVTPYPDDEFLLENPFLMNECVTVNQAWSTMMLEDQVFLRSQSNSSTIFIPGEGDNNAATEPPEEEENEADDYFTIEQQDDDAEEEYEGSDSPTVNEAGNLINGTATSSPSTTSSGILDGEINEDDWEEPVIDLEENQIQGVTDSDTIDDQVNADDEDSDSSTSDKPSGATTSSTSSALSTCFGLVLSMAHAFCSIPLV